MKRFHVHVHVADLDRCVEFYSSLFDAAPARLELDYAKWMLDDPRVNFAISTRGGAPGIDHLGIQTDNDEELVQLKQQAERADASTLFAEGKTACCYARSDKHWVTDPQGVAWEHFHTLANIPVFSEKVKSQPNAASACCEPTPARGKALGVPVKSASSCC